MLTTYFLNWAWQTLGVLGSLAIPHSRTNQLVQLGPLLDICLDHSFRLLLLNALDAIVWNKAEFRTQGRL